MLQFYYDADRVNILNSQSRFSLFVITKKKEEGKTTEQQLNTLFLIKFTLNLKW